MGRLGQNVFKLVRKLWLVLFVLSSLAFVASYFYHDALKLERKFQLSVGFLLITAFMQLAFWFTASSIWRQIVFYVSTTRLSLLQSYSQLAVVGIGKYLPGKVWGMVARGLQLKKLGLNTEEVLLATFYEQYALLHASLTLCAAMAVFLVPAKFIWLMAVTVGIVLVIGSSMRHSGVHSLVYVWQKIRKEKLPANHTTIEFRSYLILLGKFITLWILNGLVYGGLYFSFFESSYDMKLIATMIVANTVGITAGFFALFAPAGVGIRELISSAILAHALPLTDAAMLSLIYRLWVVVMEMLSGIAILPVATASITKKTA